MRIVILKIYGQKKKDPIAFAHLLFYLNIKKAMRLRSILKNAAKKQKLNKIALLYRTHFQSRALEEALLKHSIPV